MKNDELCKLHFVLSIFTRSIEAYLNAYRDVLNPIDYMKGSYQALNLRYLSPYQQFVFEIDKLRSQNRLNQRNCYATIGLTVLNLNEKELCFFTNLMIARARLFNATEPIEDDFLFNQPISLFESLDSYLIPGSLEELSDDEHDFMGELCPDHSDLLIKIDKKLESRFHLYTKLKLSEFQVDKEDEFILDVIKFLIGKKKA